MYRMVFFSRNHCPNRWEEKLIRGRTILALYPLTISLHGSVIEIPRRLSLASSTGAIDGGMTPGSVTLDQFMVSGFKVAYLFELSSRSSTDSVTNTRTSAEGQFA